MKLGIVLAAQPSSFSAIPFKEGLEENIAKIKKLGYDGAELAVLHPDQLNLEWLQAILDKNKLNIIALQTGLVLLEDKLSFTNTDPVVRRKAIDRIRSHVRLGKKLNALVIIGLVRGKERKSVSNEQIDEWLTEALVECAREDTSVRLAIEPINRYETEIINDLESCLKLLDKVKMKNVGILLDTFHMNIEEVSMSKSIKDAREHLFHVHVADSNRWYPGAGHINFKEILDTLEEINYQGFVSAEILAKPDPDTAAKKTIEYLRSL